MRDHLSRPSGRDVGIVNVDYETVFSQRRSLVALPGTTVAVPDPQSIIGVPLVVSTRSLPDPPKSWASPDPQTRSSPLPPSPTVPESA
jgi:hypothetical protein